MISIKRLLAGDGYRYLLRTVADGEGAPRELSSPMTRYYAEAGTPHGQWIGSGLAGLGRGIGLEPGSRVTEEQMARLYRDGHDPLNDERLVRQSDVRPLAERIRSRVARLSAELPEAEWRASARRIEEEESARVVRRPVAAFDLTFSPAKSVSILWALADAALQKQIVEAHHAAVADIIRWIERDVARTRVGAQGVAQVSTRGVIAAAFDHFESRAGDPQLHTHVVIANRVQAEDGRWRTLDSHGALFPAVVALSETYDALLADRLTREIGVAWKLRPGRKLKNSRWEIRGVDDRLIEAFSQRSQAIRGAVDELIAEWTARHARRPDDATILHLRQKATLDTRPDKELRSLRDLIDRWSARARTFTGPHPQRWARRLTGRPSATSSAAFTSAQIDTLADEALSRLGSSRSTWRRWNIHAEAARTTMGMRLSSTDLRDTLLQRVVDSAQRRSVLLTSPPRAGTPQAFRRIDGSSAFDPINGEVFSSCALLDAEDRLVAAARSVNGPASRGGLPAPVAGEALSTDQLEAVQAIVASGRELDLLVGPAGAGKTTALRGLAAVWKSTYGSSSVVAMAPSANAAQVLGDALGVPTENIAKWINEIEGRGRRERAALELEQRAQTPAPAAANRLRNLAAEVRREAARWSFAPDQLVIVDEASLAGTLALDALAAQTRAAGAKLLLVGDWAQLSAVDAGGAFGLLVRDRSYVPELTDVRRFTADWEPHASKLLRAGDESAVAEYQRRQRIHAGPRDETLDRAYRAWAIDEGLGRSSLLIAGDAATVTELNTRARSDLVAAGRVDAKGASLHDGTLAGQGDRVVARRNERRLHSGPGWVKNGDQFDVVRLLGDGSLVVRRSPGGPVITLPSAYVADEVELAYATTAHRAQGMTVDTAHAVLTGRAMTREVLYVSMTRGREANHVYVCTDVVDDYDLPSTGPSLTGTEVLAQVLRNAGAELSARETIHAEQERVGSIAVLAPQYETIAARAMGDRWTAMLQRAGLPLPRQVAASDDYAGLVAAARRADAFGLDLDKAMSQLARLDPLPLDPESATKIMRGRVERWVTVAAGDRPIGTRFIAGLVPAATHVDDPEMKAALEDREHLIEARAKELVRRATAQQVAWLRELGPRPGAPAPRARWDERAATVAAYRERYHVNDSVNPLGAGAGRAWGQRADFVRASAAITEAKEDGRPAATRSPFERPQRAPDLTVQR